MSLIIPIISRMQNFRKRTERVYRKPIRCGFPGASALYHGRELSKPILHIWCNQHLIAKRPYPASLRLYIKWTGDMLESARIQLN